MMKIFILFLYFLFIGKETAFSYDEKTSENILTNFSNYAPIPSSRTGIGQPLVTKVKLSALFEKGAKEIKNGLVWHIFKTNVSSNGKLPLVAKAKGGISLFFLEPGNYLVHASFGYASAVKRISVTKNFLHETLVLNAGGLKLEATSKNNLKDIKKNVFFSIFGYDKNSGKKSLLISQLKPGVITPLNTGLYHVVSTYGSTNCVVNFDIRVDSGKLTEASVEHYAGKVTLKLVRESGGEALADTSISILTENGDSILEKVGSYVSVVLAEGKYIAVAKNRNRVYQREFVLKNGSNTEIELVTNQKTLIDNLQGSGD